MRHESQTGARRLRVTMYSTDGVNPYAAEVVSLLAREDVDVELLDARNGEHRPAPAVHWRRVLPENYGTASPARQVLALAHGLLAVAGASLRGRLLLVSFTRFPVEDLLLAALGALGRPVVAVVHNPVPREAETRVARLARRALSRQARRIVVHAERLRDQVDAGVQDKVAVCPHPPYVQTVPDAPPSLVLDPGRTWLAFIGALRWDKGIDLVPHVLERVPEPVRARLGVVVCGRGRLAEEPWRRVGELGVEVCDLTSEQPVPQEMLLDVLRNRPLLLAPYVAATQSGSVILALSLGCRVLAFDEGGIPDVVEPAGLVPAGDLDAMAAAVAEHRGGAGREPVGTWAADAARVWAHTLRSAGAS